MAESTKYRCEDCGFVCAEEDMESDMLWGEGMEDEAWSNHICPKCKTWHIGINDGWAADRTPR